MHGSYSYVQPSNTTRKVSKRSQEPDKKGVNWRHNWKDYTYAGREKSRIFRIGEELCTNLERKKHIHKTSEENETTYL